MFRVRFSSGEEALFPTVDELAVGIQSGLIPSNAEIYHGKSQRWLPIAVHPVYGQAAALTRTVVASAFEPLEPIHPVEVVTGGEVQVLQMISQSGLELQERRRPKWVAPVVGLLAALAIAAGLAWLLKPRPLSSVAEAAIPARAIRHLIAARVGVSPFSTHTLRFWDYAPANLASRMAASRDGAVKQLGDSAKALGLANLLDPGRMSRAETVLATYRALGTLQLLFTRYRAAERWVAATYEDSAAMLSRTGAWTRSDLDEWRTSLPRSEFPPHAARADSLLEATTRFYALLVNQQGEYEVTSDGLRFGSQGGSAEYDALRASLLLLAGPAGPTRETPSPTLALLLVLVGDGSLPPLLPSYSGAAATSPKR